MPRNLSPQARADYNAHRPTVSVAGRALDMTNGNYYHVLLSALVHGATVTLRERNGKAYTLKAREEDKASHAKGMKTPAGWWDVWTTMNGARFAEGRNRGGMGCPLMREDIAAINTAEVS